MPARAARFLQRGLYEPLNLRRAADGAKLDIGEQPTIAVPRFEIRPVERRRGLRIPPLRRLGIGRADVVDSVRQAEEWRE